MRTRAYAPTGTTRSGSRRALRTLTQVVGNRLQATGRWPHTPENRNFEGAPPAASSSSSIQSIHDGDYHRLRRAEFTVVGLA